MGADRAGAVLMVRLLWARNRESSPGGTCIVAENLRYLVRAAKTVEQVMW